MTMVAEELDSGMGGGGVTGCNEGTADVVANESAFGINSMDINREARGKDVKGSTGRNRRNMWEHGGDGSTESNFLEEWVGVQRWKRGEGGSGGGSARAQNG